MAESTSVRVEIGFDGGQILSWLVTTESADALDRIESFLRGAAEELDRVAAQLRQAYAALTS